MTVRALWILPVVALTGLLVLWNVPQPTGLDEAFARSSGNPRGPAPAGANPAQIRGARFFDQAIAWINDNKPGVTNITTFFAHLEDVQLDVHDSHQEGYLRIWFKAPDKFRQEWRQTRELTRATPVTTKILSGDRMWIISPDGTPRRVHGTAGGARAVQQLKDDRDRLGDLAKFLTLEGLKGPGVTFEDIGTSDGSGVFEGEWARVERKLVGGAEMVFYFAHEKNAAGDVVRVTYPGIVVVRGDPLQQEPTEAYILKNWKPSPQFRYPAKIEAYAREDWKPAAKYVRFLLGFASDIRLNVELVDAGLFDDPMRRR